VLNKNFPNVPIHNDIKKLDGNQFSDIFLMTGGFPCQDISIAGKGEGIEGKRSGLWSEMCRLIGEVRPRYALIENVPMLIHRGLKRVLCDLAEIGYDAEWQTMGADEVGAWHRRKRIWIVAYPKKSRTRQDDRRIRSRFSRANGGEKAITKEKIVAYPRCEHGERKKVLQKYEKQDKKKNAIEFKRSTKRNRERITSRTEEFSNSNSSRRKEQWWTESIQEKFITAEYSSKTKGSYWITEPNVGRVANGIPNRVDRLKGLGNAIVPQCSEVIMEMIKCQYY
jgi:DNA (cytosine-5)-methyltransferase 1